MAAFAADGGRSSAPLPPGPLAGFIIAILAVAFITAFSYRSLREAARATERVAQSLDMRERLEAVLSDLKDAETGQRGYLLTGAENYLLPYSNAKVALAVELKTLRGMMAGASRQLHRLDLLEALSADKMGELGQTIALRRGGDADAALAIVRTDRGKVAMDRIRTVLAEMLADERATLDEREGERQSAANFSFWVTGSGAVLLVLLIGAAAVVTSRDYRARETEVWLRAGQAGLSQQMSGDPGLAALGERVIGFLARYLDARVGALYLAEADGRFRRFGAYALAPAAPPGSPDSPDEWLRPGDGLLGQAANDARAAIVRNVPEGYLAVASATGHGQARELLLAPARVDGVVQAVIELGFFRSLQAADLELLDRVAESLAIAVRSSKDRTRLEALLEETQRQAAELQAQQEELRVGNEELESQGRALQASQAELEVQQTELEQSNARLESNAQLLEQQKAALTQAHDVMAAKAAELARASQYKTEFLANMSHELRTPLNSTLILAKLLADNGSGNLNPEQVKFAQTISSAGNDLLTLINDILDLSKIEAGKVEVDVQPVAIGPLVEALIQSLRPMALKAGLALGGVVEPGTPESIETDAQRLGQILRNLLANALKFTPAGSVGLRVHRPDADHVAFAVRDTGIGIAEHQQELIFDAFRQADGSTHRKYGGTGLGLSISRDLARLLGGAITVESAPGQGSVFTLTLPRIQVPSSPGADTDPAPEAHATAVPVHRASGSSGPAIGRPAEPQPRRPASAPVSASSRARRAEAPAAAAIDDDREQLKPDSRLILIIEDDIRFAAILRDLAHEMKFQCVLTHSAGDGLAAASAYRPSAILLDMNLPDHSGLGVLDQLKRDALTRHIPVHVLSVADYSHEARELGAIGYDLKPVKREQLVEALQRLEARFAPGLRRVLVVEDDERQRESIRELLRNGEVQITVAETAREALFQLKAQTFDCMVMDLNLPDLSGYDLLEQMAGEEDAPFPPVIVYTGRSLTADEEQQLRRYSKSIIIKDARSPERLLDEVTLFLHQVEASLPAATQALLKAARNRDATLEGRRILIVEDDVRNIFALSSVLEPKGAKVELARNGLEALDALGRSRQPGGNPIDLVLMDIMMPEMDGYTAMREIRKSAEWKKLPIIALTAKAMKDDQEKCLAAGANDYIAKPLDVETLLSLVRVWMPK